MKPMLLTPAEEAPSNKEWLYETKYDGFRCLLHWDQNEIKLESRNQKDLTLQFPEIVEYIKTFENKILPILPLTLDGEICYLVNNYKSDFSVVQTRGRSRNVEVISGYAQYFPCHFITFDLVRYKGLDVSEYILVERKALLNSLFQSLEIEPTVRFEEKGQLQLIEVFDDDQTVWEKVKNNGGEGYVAKKKSSIWTSGIRSKHWLKIKNWRFVTVILTKYDQENGYFHGAVYKNRALIEVVIFKHGLNDNEFSTLVSFFKSNGTQKTSETWELEPSICVSIACIDFDGKKLREPRFSEFVFDTDPDQVDWRLMQRQLNPIPEIVQITHPDKPVWPKLGIVKDDYLFYLQTVAPNILPFIKDRYLTAIRFPHGVSDESFYQKNAPDYTPSFIKTIAHEDIQYILCNNLETLLWLGNQLALEFHVPFQTFDTHYPTEIVFDLDPPSVNEFSLAIHAALRMKAIFDQFGLQSFVKTSGGKGIQVYIPLPKNTFTYDETRIFTEFVCIFLVEQEPKWFTIERLKKNRNNKLYLDYIQHAEGKTIIAPYSTRGNENGLVATPLNWEEVNEQLRPELFSIPDVIDRLKSIADPFQTIREVGENQNFKEVLSNLKELLKERKK
nr:DNA ligase D [Lysinibacillus timonensis]